MMQIQTTMIITIILVIISNIMAAFVLIVLLLVYFHGANTQAECGDNCALCQTYPLYICSQCKPGSYLVNNYYCNQCTDGCSFCLSNLQCKQCLPGHTLAPSYGLCLKCTQFCYSCSISQKGANVTNIDELQQSISCDKCWQGFYLAIQDNQFDKVYRCRPCVTACIQCDDSNSCINCSPGFGYNTTSNQCYSCGEECFECDEDRGCSTCRIGYRKQVASNQTICIPCDGNCYQCNDNGSCISCLFSYYLSEQSCQECPSPCLNCDSPQSCLVCQIGYYLDLENNCQACSEGCSDCQSENSCQECHPGYYLTEQFQCKKCSSSCMNCFSNNGSCYQCSDSSYLKQGQCISCPFPCSTCYYAPKNDSNYEYICKTCQSQQYIVFENQCIQCLNVQQYTGCLTCSEKLGCLTCQTGYNFIGGSCQEEPSMKVIYIVLISIAIVIGLAGVGFGIWACWKSRSGYGATGGTDASGVKESYYEFP